MGGQLAVDDALRAAATMIVTLDGAEVPEGIVDLGLNKDVGREAPLLRPAGPCGRVTADGPGRPMRRAFSTSP
ncbi:hypothetical protein ATK36_0583 [Amycolatopsis sulphurea]|uniref:Uncharacterized protein n=1 Tax=Amycolatopsis sulphurea TaxID=76022 RepID=A0A2A9G2R7_9PSEU|nr:hypothetical protein ATK36_0583 [Amycolatopsis sulphurea]